MAIENPNDIFEKGAAPLITENPWFLSLRKGGIRSLAYDDRLGGYFIISHREDKKGKVFKLWLWKGGTDDRPKRITIDNIDSIDRAEGITPFVDGDERRLLIAFDDGNALRRIGANYQIVDYEDLIIED